METANVINMPMPDVIEVKTMAIPDQARGIIVVNNESMERANTLLLDIRALRKEVEATFKPLAQKAFEAHKAIKAQWDKAEAPLKEGETILKSSIRNYMDEVERIRREEERRLQEIARKQEEERRLAEALLAEAEGNIEEAQAILDEPDFVPMPTVKADIPKVDNRLFRKVWKFRIVDEGQIPRQYMTPDMVKIGGVVRAMKGVTNIPGIQVYEE